MTKEQKASLVAACAFYVLTIVGFFYFSVTLIILVFLLFTLSITYFAYLCYKAHNDYTGAEHLQQEIGILKAEKESIRGDYEILVRETDEELEKRQTTIDDLKESISRLEREKEDALTEARKASVVATKVENQEFEGLLPPDDDDDADNVDIIEVARRAIKELEADAMKVGLRITISSISDKLMVRASAKRLLIMFRNIIDNSIKYMQTEGTLVITISAIEDDIFIVLKDSGKGLPENETKHIFELNYQGSNRISGNGLGLTQAKAIVEHYGGTIYARSPQGNGMGIYIQLPTT
jgi:signal transduction histidine kinase